jgi:6-phosphogluconolactonase
MSQDRMQWRPNLIGQGSRRKFLKGAVAFGAAGSALAWAGRDQASSASATCRAYVGTYSSRRGTEASQNHGEGIYLFDVDRSTGGLRQRELVANVDSPSALAIDPSRTHLYSANEISTFQGTHSGSVSAYLMDRASGHLTLLNTVSSEGADPNHLSVHPSGKYVFVANYGGGSVAVLPIRSNGELGHATNVKHDKGTLGSARAASAPPGSFATDVHEGPHAHMVQPDPAGNFVLASDLGLDQIFVWKFDVQKGTLSPTDPPSVSFPSGDGPRHFAFHPNGRWVYSLQEEGSTLVTFDYDAAKGRLAAKQTISSLPEGFAGANFPSEVKVSSDGKSVYAANRVHDSIAWFDVGAEGKLTYAGEEWTRGELPRSFGIDPSGSFLYACNPPSDAITTFRVNRETGDLSFTGQYTQVGTPSMIIFLE